MPRAAPIKQKLMPLTVTKLQPKDHTFLVWDTYQRGLALRIQPSGHRSYVLIYRHHGRPRWFLIGAADAIALALQRRLIPSLFHRARYVPSPSGTPATTSSSH